MKEEGARAAGQESNLAKKASRIEEEREKLYTVVCIYCEVSI